LYIGRRAIVTTLGGSGVRVSELCDMRIRDLRLHTASGEHFLIPEWSFLGAVRAFAAGAASKPATWDESPRASRSLF
jgi:hypothetical protein